MISKYKGKDDKGTWHYGFLYDSCWSASSIIRTIRWSFQLGRMIDEDTYVDKRTVSMFTGELDINTTEIYENDKVVLPDGDATYIHFKQGSFYAGDMLLSSFVKGVEDVLPIKIIPVSEENNDI